MKKERGITLVALVITVIIMLILAGVALSSITGEEGLFARANHAVKLYENASQTEAGIVNQLLNSEYLENMPTLITDLAKSGKLKVGDYIDYDAGTWKESDLKLIDDSIKAYGGSLNGTTGTEEDGNKKLGVSSEKPTLQGQFGGFNIGDSRNSNSTPYSSSWIPRTEGWRIWDIDESTGEVTIIHAGHPETYYHGGDGNSKASINILRNRDCSMYENSYAKENSAHFLMGWEAAKWYTKNCLTDEERTSGLVYELEGHNENIDNDDTIGDNNFYYPNGLSSFVTADVMPVIDVLENHSYYWLASSRSDNSVYSITAASRLVNSGSTYERGVRTLVSLKTDILLELDTHKTEDNWNLWKIVEN